MIRPRRPEQSHGATPAREDDSRANPTARSRLDDPNQGRVIRTPRPLPAEPAQAGDSRTEPAARSRLGAPNQGRVIRTPRPRPAEPAQAGDSPPGGPRGPAGRPRHGRMIRVPNRPRDPVWRTPFKGGRFAPGAPEPSRRRNPAGEGFAPQPDRAIPSGGPRSRAGDSLPARQGRPASVTSPERNPPTIRFPPGGPHNMRTVKNQRRTIRTSVPTAAAAAPIQRSRRARPDPGGRYVSETPARSRRAESARVV